MKSTNYLFFFILTFLLTISSCKKDENVLSVKEMLTAKTWKLQSTKINGEEVDFEECEKDNVLTFFSNGTYRSDPGENKCSLMEEIESGSWSLFDNEKYLIIDEVWTITIVEISNSKLVILETVGTENHETTLIAL